MATEAPNWEAMDYGYGEVAAIKQFTLTCPKCGSVWIRVNKMVEAIHLLGIDPLSGEITAGALVEQRDCLPAPIYFCRDCEYENVVSTVFVKEVTP